MFVQLAAYAHAPTHGHELFQRCTRCVIWDTLLLTTVFICAEYPDMSCAGALLRDAAGLARRTAAAVAACPSRCLAVGRVFRRGAENAGATGEY